MRVPCGRKKAEPALQHDTQDSRQQTATHSMISGSKAVCELSSVMRCDACNSAEHVHTGAGLAEEEELLLSPQQPVIARHDGEQTRTASEGQRSTPTSMRNMRAPAQINQWAAPIGRDLLQEGVCTSQTQPP